MGMFMNGLKHGKGKWKKKTTEDVGKSNTYEGEYQ
jgi:hypothetical protein